MQLVFSEFSVYFLQASGRISRNRGDGMLYRQDGADLILRAARQARDLGHSYVGTVHLLLALAELGSWEGRLIRSHGLSPELMRD